MGSKGAWKGPYLDPKRASKRGPIRNLKGAPLGPYGSIGALRGPH
jgi:hypothetical protein